MSHTATVEKKTTTVLDGWSRDRSVPVDMIYAFQVYQAVKYGDVPAYVLNLLYEEHMGFQAFLDKNGIPIAGDAPILTMASGITFGGNHE